VPHRAHRVSKIKDHQVKKGKRCERVSLWPFSLSTESSRVIFYADSFVSPSGREKGSPGISPGGPVGRVDRRRDIRERARARACALQRERERERETPRYYRQLRISCVTLPGTGQIFFNPKHRRDSARDSMRVPSGCLFAFCRSFLS